MIPPAKKRRVLAIISAIATAILALAGALGGGQVVPSPVGEPVVAVPAPAAEPTPEVVVVEDEVQ